MAQFDYALQSRTKGCWGNIKHLLIIPPLLISRAFLTCDYFLILYSNNVLSEYIGFSVMIRPVRNRQDISTLEPTRYEVAIFKNGVFIESCGFAARKAKIVLLDIAYANSALIVDLCGDDDLNAAVRYSREGGLSFGSVTVNYTQRTERDLASLAATETPAPPESLQLSFLS